MLFLMGKLSQPQQLIRGSGLRAPKGRGGCGKGLFFGHFYMLVSLWEVTGVGPGGDLL